MINPKAITLGEKKLFESYIGKTENSTLNFTTLFIWAASGNIKYDIVDDCLVLFFYGRRGVSCTYPKGNGDKKAVSETLYAYMKETSSKARFILMSEEEAAECKEIFGKKVDVRPDPDNADYVYESESLITLKGKKLHQKRNHLNAFLNAYDFQYERLTSENKEECIALFQNWLYVVKENTAGFSEHATMCLLEHMDELHDVMFGGIRIDGNLVAFSAGEAITDDMALIHMEYGNTEIRGVFNAMNQQFVMHEWKDYSYINREEDMGLPGLRKAKLAYRPVKMIEKYIAEEIEA